MKNEQLDFHNNILAMFDRVSIMMQQLSGLIPAASGPAAHAKVLIDEIANARVAFEKWRRVDPVA